MKKGKHSQCCLFSIKILKGGYLYKVYKNYFKKEKNISNMFRLKERRFYQSIFS